ncbi:dihydrodipicolinate synthase family protein [Rhodococcus sp. D2-41]|uniref:Dihydrodipicolinate synthase family protein n=1 Tax=Speluncibacter jeojiensis TaxID=2710754 RepID=A0A9X4LWU4_9ACTN|nr:dihydrodipicolinate synthase family protein [Rhodococcus sp. D2-41]MDG3010899.1 dihydrodipicolinate synthase family protein [Rhodococcus sp. D2-41]MDG3013873.1 dihydrodipicolinate synthase family protein [Corynebacteriales bacterium D3-21]
MSEPITGIVGYPVTPFVPDDPSTVNVEVLHQLIDRMIDAGVDAIAPLGSTGESAYLDHDEWVMVATESIRNVAARVPTVVGVSDVTTAGAVERARVAESLGATALMATPVSYWPLTEEEVRVHFTAIAAAVTVPLMAYNNPATTGIDMSPEFLVRLVAAVPNITMVKESSGDIGRMRRLRELSEGSLPYFNGRNPLALQAFDAGAAGWCTAAACLVPHRVVAFHRAVVAGDAACATECFAQMEPLLELIVSRGLPTTVKSGLRSIGIDAGDPRRPLLPLGAAEAARLAGLIAACER